MHLIADTTFNPFSTARPVAYKAQIRLWKSQAENPSVAFHGLISLNAFSARPTRPGSSGSCLPFSLGWFSYASCSSSNSQCPSSPSESCPFLLSLYLLWCVRGASPAPPRFPLAFLSPDTLIFSWFLEFWGFSPTLGLWCMLLLSFLLANSCSPFSLLKNIF